MIGAEVDMINNLVKSFFYDFTRLEYTYVVCGLKLHKAGIGISIFAIFNKNARGVVSKRIGHRFERSYTFKHTYNVYTKLHYTLLDIAGVVVMVNNFNLFGYAFSIFIKQLCPAALLVYSHSRAVADTEKSQGGVLKDILS